VKSREPLKFLWLPNKYLWNGWS